MRKGGGSIGGGNIGSGGSGEGVLGGGGGDEVGDQDNSYSFCGSAGVEDDCSSAGEASSCGGGFRGRCNVNCTDRG